MWKSNRVAAVLLAVVAAYPFGAFAGGGSLGVGGATEMTQIMNNGELVKVGIDSAQTASTTVSQYITQLEQYRNQLLNTVGLDPAIVGAEVRKIAQTYQTVNQYQYRLQNLKGSLEQQKYIWDDRVARARSGNLRLSDYMALEKQRAERGDQLAKQRMEDSKRVLDQAKQDIEDVNASRARLPGSLGMNESIQELHGVTSKIAVQNATMITLMNEKLDSELERRAIEEKRQGYQGADLQNQRRVDAELYQRQKDFSTKNWRDYNFEGGK